MGGLQYLVKTYLGSRTAARGHVPARSARGRARAERQSGIAGEPYSFAVTPCAADERPNSSDACSRKLAAACVSIPTGGQGQALRSKALRSKVCLWISTVLGMPQSTLIACGAAPAVRKPGPIERCRRHFAGNPGGRPWSSCLAPSAAIRATSCPAGGAPAKYRTAATARPTPLA